MSVRESLDAAVRHHLRAKAYICCAEDDLRRQEQEQNWRHAPFASAIPLVERVRRAAQQAAPAWLSAPWPVEDASVEPAGSAFEGCVPPVVPVCVGAASSGSDMEFPVLVPLLGAGHIVINGDRRDAQPQVGLLRGIVLRLAASLPPGSLRILPVDAASRGLAFTPFNALIDGGVMAPSAPDVDGFRRVLEQAEKQTDVGVRQGLADNLPYLVVAVASFPHLDTRGELVRLRQLAKAGPEGRVHLIVVDYPPDRFWRNTQSSQLDLTTFIRLTADGIEVTAPDGKPFFGGDNIRVFPLTADVAPSDSVIKQLCAQVQGEAYAASHVGLSTILPAELWQETSVDRLTTVLGLEGNQLALLTFDDQTPHWLVGGPTGSGKTVFLIDLLYGLACRYSPHELNLYLLDFKEGVSFTEFTPRAHHADCPPDCSMHDPTWIPHARVVGIESDRQYGVAVLRTLATEMGRRATDMKRVGVQSLAALRTQRPSIPYPRIVAVIDEFQHLFGGTDELTNQAVTLLESLARKGRSYGIHLVLASQTAAGIRALYDKKEAVFGQFAMRIALRGSRTVLDPDNSYNSNLPLGVAIVNPAAGHRDYNRIVRFPNATADQESLRRIRQELWCKRIDDCPPAVFAGYASQHLDGDPAYLTLRTDTSRPVALVGRFIDVGLPTAGFPLDPTVGRHVAILGTKPEAAHILNAAVRSLGKQHTPQSARFVLAPFVNPDIAHLACKALTEFGHQPELADLASFRRIVHELAAESLATSRRTYVVIYGIDAVNAALEAPDERGQTAVTDLRRLFRDGPGFGVHVLGWWRGYSRFAHTVVGQYGVGAHNEVACVVAVNISAAELAPYLGGVPPTEWVPQENRAYVIDTGENCRGIIVPFTPADSN